MHDVSPFVVFLCLSGSYLKPELIDREHLLLRPLSRVHILFWLFHQFLTYSLTQMKAVGINQQRNAEVRFITFFLYSFPYSSIQSFPFSPSRPLSFNRLFLLFSTWFFRFSFFFSLFPSHLIFPFPLPFLSIPSSFLPFICFSFILSVLPLFFSSKSSSFLYLSSFVSFLCSFISSFLYFFVSLFIRSVISLFLYLVVPLFSRSFIHLFLPSHIGSMFPFYIVLSFLI